MELNLKKRWGYLAVGIFAMLFSGVLYAWSILKIPFKEVFGWSDSSLALNFTLTMCFFCIGAFCGGQLSRRIGTRLTLMIAGILVGIGFVITGILNADMLFMMYVGYAVLAGFGIGISYNVTVATVSAWFPDRKGFCSGCLMMGFGFSTLLLGNVISKLFENPAIGWSRAYMLLGIGIGAVIIIAGLILKRPGADTVLPEAKSGKAVKGENFERRDYTTAEMVKTFTYWRAFVCLVFIAAVGNSVISFARDLVLSVDAAPALATTLVGVLAIFNGLGRILTGAIFDVLGRRVTMIAANVLTIVAAGITLLAVSMHSLPLCITGLCLTGISYGSCPTVTSAFTAAFYGQKYFPVNFSITNFNLIGASLIATVSNNLLISTGNYTAPFMMLLILSICALGLNLSVRRP